MAEAEADSVAVQPEPDPEVELVAGQAVLGSVVAPKSVAEQAALEVLGDPVVEQVVLEALVVLDDPAAELVALVGSDVQAVGPVASEALAVSATGRSSVAATTSTSATSTTGPTMAIGITATGTITGIVLGTTIRTAGVGARAT